MHQVWLEHIVQRISFSMNVPKGDPHISVNCSIRSRYYSHVSEPNSSLSQRSRWPLKIFSLPRKSAFQSSPFAVVFCSSRGTAASRLECLEDSSPNPLVRSSQHRLLGLLHRSQEGRRDNVQSIRKAREEGSQRSQLELVIGKSLGEVTEYGVLHRRLFVERAYE